MSHRLIASIALAGLLTGCSTLPEGGQWQPDKESHSFFGNKVELEKKAAECALKWYEKSSPTPKSDDLASLGAAFGIGAEAGVAAAPAALVVYHMFIKPRVRKQEMARYIKICIKAKTGRDDGEYTF